MNGGKGWGGDKGGKGWGGGGGGKGGKGKDDAKGKGKAAQKIAAGEKPSNGQVRMFNAEKSSGFIANCQDAPGQEVYAFKDVLERGKAGPGDSVAFFIHWSAKNQPQASHPLIRISAPEGSGQFALKGYFKPGPNYPEGHGFLTCDETKEFFGRDVYVHKDLAPTLTQGQVVAFNCHLNKDGMPNITEAVEVDDSWEPTPSDLSQTWEAEIVIKGGGKGKAPPVFQAGGKAAGKADMGGGGNQGQIAQMQAMMDQLQTMMGVAQGGGGAKGGHAAPAWGGGGATAGKGWGGGADSGKGKGWGGGKAGGGKVGGKDNGKSAGGKPPPSTGETFIGIVKSFNTEKNYGFIECDEVKEKYACDVFTHGKELWDKEVGSMVYFEVGLNKDGKPQGLNVTKCDDADAGPPAKKQKTGWSE